MGSCMGRKRALVVGLSSKTFVLDSQLLDRFTGHQVKYLKSKFHECSNNTVVDKKGLLQLFPGLKSFPPQIITKCFNLFSENSSQIKFRTFCLILAQLLLSSKEDQSSFVFSLFDSDSDEKLNEQELDIFLRSQSTFLRKLSENLGENIKLHKEKIGGIPVEKFVFLNWSLRNIELSDMLKPFEIIPSPSSEKNIISSKLLNNERLEANECVFLLNSEWWDVWKAYVRFEPEEDIDLEESNNEFASILPVNRKQSARLGDRPVAIDNVKLLENETSIGLRLGLRPKIDFISVKKDVWEQLVEWYGGGPVLQRKVLFEHNKLVIELYPLIFHVIPVDNQGNLLQSKKKAVAISKSGTIQDLFLVSCKAFEKVLEYSRLLAKLGTNWGICDNSKGISALEDGSEVIIETGYIERSVVVWPRDNQNKLEQSRDKPVIASNSVTASSSSNRSGTSEKPGLKVSTFVMQGISGLANLGNTCFLNSVLQSILHTPMFAEFFTGESVLSFINPAKSKDKGLLTVELNNLAKEMALSKTSKVSPVQFHKHFLKHFPMFSGKEQHDCHECLSLALDSLHQELSRVGENAIANPLVLENPADKQTEIKEADDQWKSLQGNRGSLISDVCGGQTRTSLTCDNCGNRKVLFEIFNNISLPIPARMEIPLRITAALLNDNFIQVSVVISKFSKISELILEVAKMLFLPKEKIILAEYYGGSILTGLAKYENEPILKYLRESSNILAYEIVNSVDVAESFGRKLVRYNSQGPVFQANQHVDVLVKEVWKTGKVVEIQGDRYLISLDYEYKRDLYNRESVASFRSHTECTSPKIMNILMYHHTIRNGGVVSIGFPQVVSIGSWYDMEELTEIATKVAMRFSVVAQKPENKELFALKILDSATLKCGLCKKCNGCSLPKDKTEINTMKDFCIGVEWQDMYFREEITQHESVAEISKINFKKPIDISSCFDSFMNKETLDSKCEKCSHEKISMQVDIWRVPDILILSLKRFAYQQGVFDKIDQPVSIPFYAFDISQWVKGVEISGGLTLSTSVLQNAYDLYAIILHSGGIAGGHYTTLIKVSKNDDNMWVLFDDASLYVVKEDPDNLMVAQNAYMLFYRRRKFSSSNVINLTYNFA